MGSFDWIGQLTDRLERKPMAVLLALSLGLSVWLVIKWGEAVNKVGEVQDLRVNDQKELVKAQDKTIEAQKQTIEMQNKILYQWLRPPKIMADSQGLYLAP